MNLFQSCLYRTKKHITKQSCSRQNNTKQYCSKYCSQYSSKYRKDMRDSSDLIISSAILSSYACEIILKQCANQLKKTHMIPNKKTQLPKQFPKPWELLPLNYYAFHHNIQDYKLH